MNEVDIKVLRGLYEFRDYADKTWGIRTQVEKLMSIDNTGKDSWNMIGYCECCHKSARLLVDWKYSNEETINFRERLTCEHCGLNSRQRFITAYLLRLIDGHTCDSGKKPVIYCYEYVTRFYKYLKSCLSAEIDIIGSEYLSFDMHPGQIVNGIRHEDAANLSFPNEYIDYIISNDVYEHVPDIAKSLEEAYRVIKKDGKLIFSIPFYYMQNEIRQRAILREGNIFNILPEQFHGNPVSDKGSLVFYDFGWDILNLCKEAGFKDAYVVTGYSILYGYMGDFPMIFIAEK